MSCDTSQHNTYTQADVDNPDIDVPTKVAAGLKAPDVAKSKGVICKMTGNWMSTDSALLYATVSEGFRPGLLNRPGGDVSRDG